MNPNQLAILGHAVAGRILTNPAFRNQVNSVSALPQEQQKQRMADIVNQHFPGAGVAPEEVPKMNEHAVTALRTSDPQHGTVTPQNWDVTNPVIAGSVGFELGT